MGAGTGYHVPMTAARFDAELWFGTPQWPPTKEIPSVKELLRWEGVGFTKFTVAGHHGHRQEFFGLVFHVPHTDALALLGASLFGSNLPGNWNAWKATPLSDLFQLKDRLDELDLELDPVHYGKFGEAYVPLEARRAWAYARRRDLKVFKHPEDETSLTMPGAMGLLEWEQVDAHLERTWAAVSKELGMKQRGLNPDRPLTAVLHYPNSD